MIIIIIYLMPYSPSFCTLLYVFWSGHFSYTLFLALDSNKEREMRETAELRSCVKVEVDVLGSPSLISLMVSADVKQHERKKRARWKIDPLGDVTCTETR